MSESITVTVAKYDKFKGRKDVEHPSWFKLSNDFLSDPDFYSFSFAEKCAWIWILSQASKKQTATVVIGFEHAMRSASIEKDVILSAVTKLKEIGAVTSASRPRNVRVTSALPREEKKREEESREEQTASPSARELFNLWNEIRGSLPEATQLTDARKKKADAQLSQQPDLDHYRSVIERWLKSDFCLADWKPGFDALLSLEKRTVTLEGRYDNRPAKMPGGQVRAPIRSVPKEAIRVDAHVGPLTEPGPRTTNMETVNALLAKAGNLGVAKKQGAS